MIKAIRLPTAGFIFYSTLLLKKEQKARSSVHGSVRY
jgi:hypothetical protein